MKTKTSYLICLQAILFAIFLLIIFFFNRFAVDDYYFIGELRDKNIQSIYSDLYFNAHGRWSFNFLVLVFLKLNTTNYFLLLYNLISCSFLVWGIFKLFSSVQNLIKLKIEKKSVIFYSIIFLSVFFFCTVSPNDSWFWYTSSVNYLWSTIAFFFALSFLLKAHKSIFENIFFIICLIYMGGSNEPLAIVSLIGLSYSFFKKIFIHDSIIGIIILSVSLAINYFSSGTIARDALTPNLGLIDLILYTGYGSLKFTFFSIYKTFIPALFAALPFFILGKTTNLTKLQFKPINQLFQSIGLIALIIILNQLIVIYVLGGLAPDRATIASSVIIALIMVRYFFLLGNYQQEKYGNLKYILMLNVIALIAFNIYYANTHYQYAKAVDCRNDYIKICRSKLIQLDPLPNSGYIYSAEISGDPDNFKNQLLKKGLGVDKDIVMVIY